VAGLRRRRGGEYFSKWVNVVSRFDAERIREEYEGVSEAASDEGLKVSGIFLADDAMTHANFGKMKEALGNNPPQIALNTRLDYITKKWVEELSDGGVDLRIGFEFFNRMDLAYTGRASNPAAYLKKAGWLIKTLPKKKIPSKAYVILMATPKWKNIRANISGAIRLLDAGFGVSPAYSLLADFSELEEGETDAMSTERFGGMSFPGPVSLSAVNLSELKKIDAGLRDISQKFEGKMLEVVHLGGADLLNEIDVLRGMVLEELFSRPV